MNTSLYDRILDILVNVLEAYSAVLFLPVRLEDGVPVYAPAGMFSLGGKLDSAALIRPREGVIGLIIHQDEPLFIPNFHQHKRVLEYYKNHEEADIKAFMGCPLPEGRGALCVDTKRYYNFPDKDKKLLIHFGGLCGELYELQRQEFSQSTALRHYAALRQIRILISQYLNWVDFVPTFLDIISKASNYEYCALCVLDRDNENSYTVVSENCPWALKRNRPEHYTLHEGLAGWVLSHGQPLGREGEGYGRGSALFSPSLTLPLFSSVLIMPLIVPSKVFGALCLANRQPLPDNAELREFVGVAAGHLALFLENFQLKEEIRNLRKKIQTKVSGSV